MIEALSKNLFGFEQPETPGENVFYRIFELFIFFIAKYALEWAFYIPKPGKVVLPPELDDYVSIEFIFNKPMALLNAVLVLFLLVVGLGYAYLAAIVLFHFQYIARFSQGEISHGSNNELFSIFSPNILCPRTVVNG